MCVFNCPLDITQAEWMASSLLLLLPPKAPVSIQDLMTHLLSMWNFFSETLASSLSFSILSILPPICCPNWSSLHGLASTFLPAGCLSVSLCPISVQSWWLTGFYGVVILGVTQPNPCSLALICSTAFSVCLLILWFAFSLINSPLPEQETVAHDSLSCPPIVPSYIHGRLT